jgi:hypothetical protein
MQRNGNAAQSRQSAADIDAELGVLLACQSIMLLDRFGIAHAVFWWVSSAEEQPIQRLVILVCA